MSKETKRTVKITNSLEDKIITLKGLAHTFDVVVQENLSGKKASPSVEHLEMIEALNSSINLLSNEIEDTITLYQSDVVFKSVA